MYVVRLLLNISLLLRKKNQNHYQQNLSCSQNIGLPKILLRHGFVPDPAEGAHSALPYPELDLERQDRERKERTEEKERKERKMGGKRKGRNGKG